jgi:hypothetical protein
MFDFEKTRALIEDGYLSSSTWLAGSEHELVS